MDFDRDFPPHCFSDYKRRTFSKDSFENHYLKFQPVRVFMTFSPKLSKNQYNRLSDEVILFLYLKLLPLFGNLHIVKMQIRAHLPEPDFWPDLTQHYIKD